VREFPVSHSAESRALGGDVSRRTALIILGCILVARLLLGLAYSVLNPLGEAPDEADHYAYAAYIGTEGRLPEGTGMTQSKHPPLYHILAAGLARASGSEMDSAFLRSNPDVGVDPDAAAPNFFVHTRLEAWPWLDGALSMHLGRLVSVIAGVVLTAATYALGRAIWPSWYAGPLAAAAFAAFLPESLFIGGAMSNDITAAMWSALALWLGLRARGIVAALLAGVAMGLAFLTKASTVGLWPVVCVAMLTNRRWIMDDGRSNVGETGRGSLGKSAVRAALAGVVASLIAIPWLWRNWRLYGDPLGWPLVLATIDRRQGPLSAADLLALVRGWFVSFWGKTGGAGQLALPSPLYILWVMLILAAVVGWLIGWRRKDQGPARQVTPAGWVVLLGAPSMTVLSILSYSRVALGTDQGRLLFPALAPIAILLVLGIAGLLNPRAYRWLPFGFGAGMAVIAVLALVTGIVLPFAPPPAPPPAEVAAATSLNESFGGQVELLAYRWGEASEGESVVPLTLYWRASRAVGEDLRATMRLSDAAGNLAWEWKRSPAAGRFSTDHWGVNRIVRDTYLVPEDALSRAAGIELGLRPFPEGEWLLPATRLSAGPLFRIEKPNP
jgi:4-amino-4-deoxy-L-arabinose transferase-like glycosyltransferase